MTAINVDASDRPTNYPPGWAAPQEDKHACLANSQVLHLYTVELTNFCNLKCGYCPHPTMQRPKGHMSAEVLGRSIEHAKFAGQDRLVLHHIGESLLHPQLEDRLRQVAQAGLGIQFSTNAVILERKLALLSSIPAHIDITLSMHLWPESSAAYFEALADFRRKVEGTNVTINQAFNIRDDGTYEFHDWTNYENKPWNYKKDCFFLRDNWGVVLWNGDIVSCCLDSEGHSTIGNVMDEGILFGRSRPWKGCSTCYLRDKGPT